MAVKMEKEKVALHGVLASESCQETWQHLPKVTRSI